MLQVWQQNITVPPAPLIILISFYYNSMHLLIYRMRTIKCLMKISTGRLDKTYLVEFDYPTGKMSRIKRYEGAALWNEQIYCGDNWWFVNLAPPYVCKLYDLELRGTSLQYFRYLRHLEQWRNLTTRWDLTVQRTLQRRGLKLDKEYILLQRLITWPNMSSLLNWESKLFVFLNVHNPSHLHISDCANFKAKATTKFCFYFVIMWCSALQLLPSHLYKPLFPLKTSVYLPHLHYETIMPFTLSSFLSACLCYLSSPSFSFCSQSHHI